MWFSCCVFSLLFFTECSFKKQKSNSVEIGQNTSSLLAEEVKAICYSGFRSGQHPDRGNGAKNPTENEILEDLKILSEEGKFNLIRLYDCGENTQLVLDVIDRKKLPIKVLLGIWLDAEISTHETCEWLKEPYTTEELDANKQRNARQIELGIELANGYSDIVVAVNVGNESLVDWNDHKVNTQSIITYVRQVKASIKQPVTVADNYVWWAENGKELAKKVDFVSIHVYPIWEGKSIENAMEYTIENVQRVRNSLPKSKIVITEAGWPSVASEFEQQANELNQQRYYNELMKWSKQMNITTFFFEAFDEDWKGDPNNLMGAEKHWGIYTIDRKPKKVMQKAVSESCCSTK